MVHVLDRKCSWFIAISLSTQYALFRWTKECAWSALVSMDGGSCFAMRTDLAIQPFRLSQATDLRCAYRTLWKPQATCLKVPRADFRLMASPCLPRSKSPLSGKRAYVPPTFRRRSRQTPIRSARLPASNGLPSGLSEPGYSDPCVLANAAARITIRRWSLAMVLLPRPEDDSAAGSAPLLGFWRTRRRHPSSLIPHPSSLLPALIISAFIFHPPSFTIPITPPPLRAHSSQLSQ
mgnify:CR=1 FL=1